MTQQSHSQAYTEETKIERDTCIPLLTAALFTTARTWKQPKCTSADEQMEKTWCIYTNGILPSLQKESNNAICCNMSGPGGYQTVM